MARYIDADALIALIKKRLINELIIGWLCGIIAEAPTIEARPVVRGRWIKRQFADDMTVAYRCSECKTTWDDKSNFCPNCGADMRGDSSE